MGLMKKIVNSRLCRAGLIVGGIGATFSYTEWTNRLPERELPPTIYKALAEWVLSEGNQIGRFYSRKQVNRWLDYDDYVFFRDTNSNHKVDGYDTLNIAVPKRELYQDYNGNKWVEFIDYGIDGKVDRVMEYESGPQRDESGESDEWRDPTQNEEIAYKSYISKLVVERIEGGIYNI